MSEKVVNAALLGLGTVGTGVYKVIRNQEQEMTAKLGCQVKITKILVRNLEKAVKKVEDPGDSRGGAERLFIRGSSCRRNSDHQSAEEQP